MLMATNQFRTLWALGYRRLVPVVPPGAPLSESSSLAHRLKPKVDGTPGRDDRGKVPGVKNGAGLWRSFDWNAHETDETDLERWHAMGAGVGIKTGAGLVAIDVDTLVHDNARIARDVIEAHFGRLPVRVGQYPKALYLARVEGDYERQAFRFGELDERGLPKELIETLYADRFFVAQGIHQKTGNPYEWMRPLPPLDELPAFSAAAVTDLMEELRAAFPGAQEMRRERQRDARNVDQEGLRARSAEHVRAALRAIPNDFPDRADYIRVMTAVKAALPDDPDAFDIAAEWAESWSGGDNDPEVVAADWKRISGPFEIGARYLYDMAEARTPGAAISAEHWFDDLGDPEPVSEASLLFGAGEKAQAERDKAEDVYPLVTINDILTRPPPRWLVERHIPEQAVGFLYSEPGIGKSFLALDLTLALATGLPDWHGDRIARPEGIAQSPIIYIASEGSFGFRNRIMAWLKQRKIPADQAKRFLMIERTINFMNPEDVQRLLRTGRAAARALGAAPAMFVVDTVSRALPGADENLQKDMTLFVEACGALQREFLCAVLGVHHAGKNGDMRGSTVLRGAGDFVFRLSRKIGASVGLLTCEKMKDGPDRWEEPYRFDVVGLDDGETSLVPEREDATVGPSCELTPQRTAVVLAAMRAAWDSGEPWAKSANTGERRAVRRLVFDHGFDAAAAESTLDLWERSGVIALVVADRNSKRKGYKVLADPGQPVLNDGIFG